MANQDGSGSGERPDSADRDRRDDLPARVAALEAAVRALARAGEQRHARLVESMGRQFEAMEKRADARHRALVDILTIRFEQVDRRFEQVDRRFEQVDRRFEQVDRRFGKERAITAGQFEAMQRRMDERFDGLIEALDIRFARLEKRRGTPPTG